MRIIYRILFFVSVISSKDHLKQNASEMLSLCGDERKLFNICVHLRGGSSSNQDE